MIAGACVDGKKVSGRQKMRSFQFELVVESNYSDTLIFFLIFI